MFKYHMNQNNFQGLLLGFYNLDPLFISSIKSSLNSNYEECINYLELTKENLTKPKIKRMKESNYNELGMISIDWLEKIFQINPSLIIQMIDITDLITDVQNINVNQICKPIIEDIYFIKKYYKDSNQLLIIKNFKNVNGLENNIKTHILNNTKINLGENNFYFINDIAYLDNNEIIKKINELIIKNVFYFYDSEIKFYLDKYNSQKSNQQKEYEIKYLIKIYFLSKIKNILVNDKNNNYYEYIYNAYETVIKLDKINYMFCGDNLKMKYLEIKNLADFLLNQILIEKNSKNNENFNLIIRHLYIFDNKNFFVKEGKEINNNNLINDFKKYKDIYFINMKWKYSWLQYLSEINDTNKSNSVKNMNNNISLLNYYKLNNLLHLYIFLEKEPDFKISFNINKEISTKKIKNKFLEKVPKFYEMEGDNITGLLTDEENLKLYLSELIIENKNLNEAGNILKILKDYFINNDLNSYDFYLINKHCKENEFKENFNNILMNIINKESNIIYKFNNVYSHLAKKINKIIFELKLEKEEKENCNYAFNIIRHFIHYASLLDKIFSKEEANKFNEILSCDINHKDNKQIIYVNGLVNKLFNIQLNYESNEVSLLDALNINIDIYLERTEILLNIEKIILYFPNDKYTKENNKNNREILINKELSKDNPIKINFKYFINHIFNEFYITNIELCLKNKIIINICNREKKDIIFYNKNSKEINIDDLIDIDIIKDKEKNIEDKIILGKNENHLLHIKYKLKKDYKDIYIKNVKINMQLNNAKNYEFKILENDNNNYEISEQKQLNYEYINTNLEKNLPEIEYILNIGEIGNFVLNYNFNFNVIYNNSPNETCILESSKNLIVECIESFIFSDEIKSPLFFTNKKTQLKMYSINYPINLISFIENKLPEKIIIHKIEHLPNNNCLEINCPTEKLFSKIKNYKINCSKNEKIFIYAKITSKCEISGSIGKLNILWTSKNLYKNKNFKDSYINNSIFDFCEININQLSLIIEAKYIKISNKYQIYIKNIENTSKMIQFNIKEENEDERYILYGKKYFKGLLTPNKEIRILYNIYDSLTGGTIDELKGNCAYKFSNIFILNEYNIEDKKDKFKEDYLRNIIYFSPELFKLTN